MNLARQILIAIVFLGVVALSCPTSFASSGAGEPTVIYLVRHAEKTVAASSQDPKNPHLNEDGVERAGDLVSHLRDAGVTGIYSTDYLRTIETVDPLAKHLDLKIETYDPGDLAGFAKKLRERPGRFVVAGHSNTNPTLVELLGGDPGPPIDEASEYDRLDILVIDDGKTTTIRLRYGAPSLLP
jgi:broad specificity phosphatase PhoE